MTVAINGTTGIDTVQPATITQAKLASNVAGNGPAFSAYQSSAQSLPNNSLTKIQFQTEEFDTNNTFDSTTNYRFQPTIAGYYQINAAMQLAGAANIVFISVYKNGTRFKDGGIGYNTAGTGSGSAASAAVFLNGSTDYIEIFAFQNSGASVLTTAQQSATYIQGYLARSA